VPPGSAFAFDKQPGTNIGLQCSVRPQERYFLTENNTPEFALRIRLKALPEPGELDEFDLSHFRLGGVFVVPSHLASLLIISGYAELLDEHPARAEAADFGQPRFPKQKD
jgi:hypothetical protein